ncbi:isoleucine--tRNA ligase [Sulfitobacter albidus]|uniref:Isoleucine--tRNA ligase n=1 Tax=Sulfitobacter albidus TaxID=2829501 RepID=A0A975PLG9_9RHOB|nr:isoleucine--tRNA ligase [Sulfitobacter albidus]QUJ75351.1 isoleucine--tRNA ligase [Sulfitobacter albidus]
MCAETPDYKSTLTLPKTDFPMRAGLPKREPAWLERWERIGIYDRLREKTGRESFTLHDGPPYANGHLHIGHALNKTIKDMIVRSHQMMGYDARYIPGWDCHGLPIEWKIEEAYRKKGRNKDDVPINEFRAECREFAAGWVDIQREEFKRLGITGNWAEPYLTMDFHAERVIAEEFMKFLMNGTLYQGSKPVMWSPIEQTALAEAEVEYHDKDSFTIWVKFEVKRKPKLIPVSERGTEPTVMTKAEQEAFDLEGAIVPIWTTTPWTIPSNKAVVFSNSVRYDLYEVTAVEEECWAKVGERYIIASKLAEQTFEKARVKDWRHLGEVKHQTLEEIELLHPLANTPGSKREWDKPRDFRAAEFVTDTEGTGFVHCAPSHGMEEYELYRDLGMLQQVITYNVLDDGSFRPDLPFFGGKYILNRKGKEGDANTAVIDKLVEVGGLMARGKIKHSYPHSWRSKAPVIYRNTPQWFAAIDKPVGDGLDTHGTTIRERALTEIDNVKWTPKSGRNRLHSMMEARPDWVLSRQRAWGVPLTCFTKRGALPTDDDYLLRNEEVNARIVEAFEADGADVWYEDGAKERFLSGIVNPDDYDQVMDILDVWFDSGSTHAFTLRDRADGSDDGIADVYMEGTDQHRGWFHSSLLQSVGTTGRAPYRQVVTHGMTLDQKGFKQSKSLGNITPPEDVIKQYGADILRLWVAQTDYTLDQRIGPEILKGTADSYRRLRNTMRYMLGALGDFTEADRVEAAEMPELERWVLHRLAELDTQVREGYARFDFQGVFRAVFDFATLDLSAFYFDIRKDALYCDGDTLRRRAARTVMDLLFHRLTTWLAPVLVFTMEEVWLERFDADDASVHLQDIPATPDGWLDADLAAKWAQVRAARRVVTAALEVQRTDKVIGASLEAAPIVYVADDTQRAALESVSFEDVSITSQIKVTGDAAPADAFRLPEVDGVAVVFAKAEGAKCARCWKVLPDIGTHAHADVCARCDDAVG